MLATLVIATLYFAKPLTAPNERVLSRGSRISDPTIHTWAGSFVWDVTDTTISAQDTETDAGGSATLEAGLGHTILIRFGELNRVVGAHRQIVGATLELSQSGGDKPVLRHVARLVVPWGEGPLTPLSALLRRPSKAVIAGNATVGPARGAASWRFRESGEAAIPWQQAGAQGREDGAPIPDAVAETLGDKVSITGLANAAQFQLEHPDQNYGFAIQFDNNVDFFSSQAATRRPTLRLTTEPSPNDGGADLSVQAINVISKGETEEYTAIVKNVGDRTAEPFSFSWAKRGVDDQHAQSTSRLKPGEATEFHLTLPSRNLAVARFNRLTFKIIPGGPDACPANNAVDTFIGAKPIDVSVNDVAGTNFLGSTSVTDWVQAQFRYWNETVAPQSRYSFATEGVTGRVALGVMSTTPGTGADTIHMTVSAADLSDISQGFQRQISLLAGAPDLGKFSNMATREDLFPDLTGGGDTRYEGSIASQITFPYEPVKSALMDRSPVEATYLLSATAVATLNALSDGKPQPTRPKTLLVRASDLMGRPLSQVSLEIRAMTPAGTVAPEAPVLARTDATGVALVPSLPDVDMLEIKANANDATETTYLKRWQLVDAASRGNSLVAIMDIRFNLPLSAVDLATDLSDNRSVTDRAGRFPAQLQSLVTVGSIQGVEMGANKEDWIEIDLRRDRTLSEVTLTVGKVAPWSEFDIFGYGTGQTIADGITLASERDVRWTIRNRAKSVGGLSTIVYRVAPTRIRYVRLVNRSHGGGSLVGVQVHPAKQGS